jgi:alpha-methylacyl-CoA racemase
VTPAPLDGVFVLDLSRHLPGPLAARLLADLGARVVKVEEPSMGDPVRQAPPRRSGVGSLAAALLGGLESVALDLKRPGAAAVLEGLIARADVLLESFRPGTLERLGFPPEDLRRRHPRLVICSVTGWGPAGPWAARAGHDLTYQALAGTLAPTAAMPAVPVADLVGAWGAVSAIVAALFRRERTGQGAHLDAALYDAAVYGNFTNWAEEGGGGPHGVGDPLPLTGSLPCYQIFPTADGHRIAFAPLEPHFWKRFCRAIGREDLAGRQYSTSPRTRREVAEVLRGRTRAEWERLFAQEDLPAEPVLSAAEARAHPQMRERALVSEGPEGLPRVAYPVRFDGERPPPGGAVPEIGDHTEKVLAELGLPAAGLSASARRKGGIGRRFSLRRVLARWFVG